MNKATRNRLKQQGYSDQDIRMMKKQERLIWEKSQRIAHLYPMPPTGMPRKPVPCRTLWDNTEDFGLDCTMKQDGRDEQ